MRKIINLLLVFAILIGTFNFPIYANTVPPEWGTKLNLTNEYFWVDKISNMTEFSLRAVRDNYNNSTIDSLIKEATWNLNYKDKLMDYSYLKDLSKVGYRTSSNFYKITFKDLSNPIYINENGIYSQQNFTSSSTLAKEISTIETDSGLVIADFRKYTDTSFLFVVYTNGKFLFLPKAAYEANTGYLTFNTPYSYDNANNVLSFSKENVRQPYPTSTSTIVRDEVLKHLPMSTFSNIRPSALDKPTDGKYYNILNTFYDIYGERMVPTSDIDTLVSTGLSGDSNRIEFVLRPIYQKLSEYSFGKMEDTVQTDCDPSGFGGCNYALLHILYFKLQYGQSLEKGDRANSYFSEFIYDKNSRKLSELNDSRYNLTKVFNPSLNPNNKLEILESRTVGAFGLSDMKNVVMEMPPDIHTKYKELFLVQYYKSEIERLRNQITTLNQNINSLRQKIQAIVTFMNNNKVENDSTVYTIDTFENYINSWKNQALLSKNVLDELQTQLITLGILEQKLSENELVNGLISKITVLKNTKTEYDNTVNYLKSKGYDLDNQTLSEVVTILENRESILKQIETNFNRSDVSGNLVEKANTMVTLISDLTATLNVSDSTKILAEVQRLKDLEDEITRLNNRIQNLEEDVRVKTTEIQRLNESISQKNTEIQNLNQTIQDKTARISSLENELQQKEDELTQLRLTNTTNEGIIRQKEQEIETLKREKQNLESERQNLNERISNLTDELNSEKRKVSNLQNQVQNLEQDNRQKDNQISQLNQRVDELNNSIQEKEREIGEKTSQIQTLTDELNNTKQEIQTLKNDVTSKQLRIDELTRLLNEEKAKVSNLEEQLREKQLELDNLRNSSSQSDIEHAEKLREKDNKISELQEALKIANDRILSLTNELDLLKEQLKNKETEIERLKEEISAKELEIEQNKLKIQLFEAEIEKFKKDILDLSKEKDTLSERLEIKNNEYNILNDKYSKLKNQKPAEPKIITKTETVTEIQYIKDEKKEKELNSKIISLNLEIERLNKEIERLKNKLKKHGISDTDDSYNYSNNSYSYTPSENIEKIDKYDILKHFKDWDKEFTRDEFAKAAYLYIESKNGKKLSDINSSLKYYDFNNSYTDYFRKNGMLIGIGGNIFAKDIPLNEKMFSVFALRYHNKNNIEYSKADKEAKKEGLIRDKFSGNKVDIIETMFNWESKK